MPLLDLNRVSSCLKLEGTLCFFVLTTVVEDIVTGFMIFLILNLLIPVTIASSCVFMLPLSTSPNAIVFANDYVKVNQMVKADVILNLIAVGLLILYYNL